jgi:hypothetical protein
LIEGKGVGIINCISGRFLRLGAQSGFSERSFQRVLEGFSKVLQRPFYKAEWFSRMMMNRVVFENPNCATPRNAF